MLRRVVRSTWRRTAGRPGRRALAGLTAVAVCAGLAYAWWPHPGTYRPIEPWDRGTVLDAVSAVRPAPTTTLTVGARGTVPAVWDTSRPMPTEAHPQLALVLLPASGTTPTAGAQPRGWVFPFDRPLAPGPGGNQALAVNTTNGTADYQAAFALVWVTDGSAALNRNEAYAFASCTRCAAVAVAFQVVLVVGDNHVAAPQNLAGALNYKCVNCLTYALAQQLFVTIRQPLSAGAMKQLDTLWREIAAFGARISAGSVSLSTIQSRLDGYEQQIKAIIATDEPGTFASPAATASPTASGSASTGPSSGSSTGSSTGASPGPSPSVAGSTPAPGTSPAASSPAGSTPSPSTQPSSAPASTTPTATATPTG
jgi:putative peptide zinc metalloprotease protein